MSRSTSRLLRGNLCQAYSFEDNGRLKFALISPYGKRKLFSTWVALVQHCKRKQRAVEWVGASSDFPEA